MFHDGDTNSDGGKECNGDSDIDGDCGINSDSGNVIMLLSVKVKVMMTVMVEALIRDGNAEIVNDNEFE